GSMGWGTYVLGPVLGAVIGVNLYGLLFAPNGMFAAAPATAVAARSTRAKAPARKKTATRRKR
ncbi:MAG TPA: hypothetical protein VFI84_03725, partial [Candidatus Saccharimonadales bacterium]|nr:hypothetical protein [Candidatus Saccharimonadales bacterium]